MKSVAIFWMVNGALFLFATPLEDAEKADVFYDSPLAHIEQWKKIRQEHPKFSSKYETYPRGRMTYNAHTKTFQLIADKAILTNRKILAAIKNRCGLTEMDKVVLIADPHYRT